MRGKKGGGDKPITKDQAEKMLMEINSLMAKTKQTLQNMNDDRTYEKFLEMEASENLTKLGKELVSEKNILETWIKFNDNPLDRVKNPIVKIRGFSWLDSAMNKINTILQLEHELLLELADMDELEIQSDSQGGPRRRLFDSDSVSSISSDSSVSTVLPVWYNSDETYYGSDEGSDGEVRRTLSFGGRKNKSKRKTKKIKQDEFKKMITEMEQSVQKDNEKCNASCNKIKTNYAKDKKKHQLKQKCHHECWKKRIKTVKAFHKKYPKEFKVYVKNLGGGRGRTKKRRRTKKR